MAKIDEGVHHLLNGSTWLDRIGLLLQGIYGDGEDTSMGGNYVFGDDSRGEKDESDTDTPSP